jgi:dihydroneopterin aldolase
MPKHSNEIILKGFEYPARIGIYDYEKQGTQTLILSVKLTYLKGHSFTSDDFKETLNYETIIETVKTTIDEKHYNLIETLAETLAANILKLASVETVTIKIEKPSVTQNEQSGLLSVKIKRSA